MTLYPSRWLLWWQLLSSAVTQLLALCLISMSSLSQPAWADLDDFFRQELNSYSNATKPQSSDAIDRGVYYGGNYSLRNQLLTLQLLSFDAPYINAGCGGIDLYAGSFSFINKEQFTQLLKAVASNAIGYSFNLALTHICPSCTQVVESLQRKIQQINQHLGNSCALAEGIVNDTVAAFTKTKNNKVSLLAHLRGLGDTFSTFSADTTSQKQELLKDSQTKEKLYGNLVYKALQKVYGNRYDQSYLEQIMSLTGTVITKPSTNHNNASADDLETYKGNLISVKTLISGGKTSQYQCANADCNKLNIVTSDKTSISQELKTLYLGDGTNPGILSIYETNQGTITDTQKHQLLMVGEGINAQIRNLALLNTDAARNFVTYALQYIALNFLKHEIEYSFELVNNALTEVKDDETIAIVRKQLQQNQQIYLQNVQIETSQYNSYNVLSYYNQLIDAFKPQTNGLKAK